jgi:TetR/AcrR family transcriptional repressor of mexJK operon
MPGGSTVDPRVERSRAVIIPVATEHFFAKGYVAANLDDVAAEARVSKRTIYNIFGGKEQLFREILDETFGIAEGFAAEVSESLAATDDVEGALETAATRLATIVLSDRVVRLRRLLIGEAERFPELASEYYARAPGRILSVIAEGFERFARRGVLQFDDPHLAAEHFAYLVVGAPLDRALFNTQRPSPRTEEIETCARQGVAAFLRAYRVG